MTSILMGVITALLVIIGCGGCFYAGYKVGYSFQSNEPQVENKKTEGHDRMAEGLANILNYANRHKAGESK